MVAKLIQIFGLMDPKQLLEGGIKGYIKMQADQMGGAVTSVGQRPIPRKGKAS